MKIKNLILKSLKQEGLNHLFMVPGGLVDPFLTAFDDQKDLTPIVAAQEGGAAYMADGYARASGKFGVCLCIGGPGAANTATALLTAKSDSSPLLVISGEVPTNVEGLGFFQDASQVALNDFDLLKPATKLSLSIENPLLFHHHFRHALTALLSQKRSPVHIDLPRDIQESNVEDDFPPLDKSFYQSEPLDTAAVEACLDDFRSTKIAFLVGEGVNTPEAALALKKLSESLEIPVATTLRAKGTFPEDHPLSLGVFGYAGTAHAIQAFLHENLEVLIVLGSGLNQRDSMNWTTQLAPTKRFIQVNVDPAAFITSYPHSYLIQGESHPFLNYLLAANLAKNDVRKAWVETIKQRPRLYDTENLTSNAIPIHPARVIHDLRAVAPKDTVVVVDSGAHRAFAGHYWTSFAFGEYISATNLGPMGWAIPAGIGAKLARPSKPCCVITGDGCMLMNGMELHTAARYQVAVVFVVINNCALGNVFLRAEQLGPTPMELTSLPDHDWAGFARSLGVQGETVRNPNDLKEAFQRAFTANAPYLIDIKCDKHFATPVEPFTETKKHWSYHD
jgi:acetolactate synthase-1/2/3 large subunit